MGLFRRSQDTLTHWGIPGQKWGVRRWQYPDGRFTEEGKERYFGKNAEKEGYVKKNKDGSYTMTDKGYKDTNKILSRLNDLGTRMSKNRNFIDKYNDWYSEHTWITKPVVYEYIRAAKKALKNSDIMDRKVQDKYNILEKGRRKYAENDASNGIRLAIAI